MGKIADAVRGTGLPEQKLKQMLSLDREFSDLEAKVEALQTENLHLKAEVKPLEREVGRLKQQVEAMQSKAAKHGLDEIEVKLLVELSKTTAAQLAEHLGPKVGASTTKAEFFLRRFYENDYVILHHDGRGNNRYSLGQRGREYLVTHDLV